MTAATPETSAPAGACPRCGAGLAAGQDWCLECGAAATTRILPTPGWRLPTAILATAIVLAGAGAAVAYVQLSDDAEPRRAGTTTTAPGPATTPPATPPAQTTPPAATPPAGTPTTPPAGTGAAPPAQTTPPTPSAPGPGTPPPPGD
jgi:hypothetical protein